MWPLTFLTVDRSHRGYRVKKVGPFSLFSILPFYRKPKELPGCEKVTRSFAKSQRRTTPALRLAGRPAQSEPCYGLTEDLQDSLRADCYHSFSNYLNECPGLEEPFVPALRELPSYRLGHTEPGDSGRQLPQWVRVGTPSSRLACVLGRALGNCV